MHFDVVSAAEYARRLAVLVDVARQERHVALPGLGAVLHPAEPESHGMARARHQRLQHRHVGARASVSAQQRVHRRVGDVRAQSVLERHADRERRVERQGERCAQAARAARHSEMRLVTRTSSSNEIYIYISVFRQECEIRQNRFHFDMFCHLGLSTCAESDFNSAVMTLSMSGVVAVMLCLATSSFFFF